MGLLPFLLPQFSCLFKLYVTLFENLLVPACKLVCGGNVADGTVQPHVVVAFDVLSYNFAGVVKRKQDAGANAFLLDGFVEALQLSV